MICEWKPGDAFKGVPADSHNFGDHLQWLFESFFTAEAWQEIAGSKTNSYTLLGSVLLNYSIKQTLDAGFVPHYLGCGYRGDALDPLLLAQTKLFGCRGAFSRQAVKEAGQNVDAIGDPAELVRLLIAKPRGHHKKFLMPHILDPELASYHAADYGCDAVLNPTTTNKDDLTELVRTIAGADFVLAGAMHAAVIAHAYDVPFAFFDTWHRDCPKKWEDLGDSIGLSTAQINFCPDVARGIIWYDNVKGDLRKTRLLPILRQANRIGPVKWKWLVKACLFDFLETLTYWD